MRINELETIINNQQIKNINLTTVFTLLIDYPRFAFPE